LQVEHVGTDQVPRVEGLAGDLGEGVGARDGLTERHGCPPRYEGRAAAVPSAGRRAVARASPLPLGEGQGEGVSPSATSIASSTESISPRTSRFVNRSTRTPRDSRYLVRSASSL